MSQALEVEEHLVDLLVARVAGTESPSKTLSLRDLNKWQNERKWIINEHRKKSLEEAYWSNSEYEFFVNKILDHIEKS